MVNVKVINTCENKCNEKIDKEIVVFYENCEMGINIIEAAFQEYLFKISSNSEYYKTNVSKAWSDMTEIDSIIDNSLQMCFDAKNQLISSREKALKELNLQALSLTNNGKEFNIIKFRLKTFRNKTIKNVKDYSSDIEAKLLDIISEKRKEIEDYLKENIGERYKKELDELQQEYYDMYLDSLIEEDNKEDKDREKIFNYKEMSKQAEDNGYIYKGARGSHNIYEHKESKKIIVIPAHNLGIGLSRKILKQIEENKI